MCISAPTPSEDGEASWLRTRISWGGDSDGSWNYTCPFAIGRAVLPRVAVDARGRDRGGGWVGSLARANTIVGSAPGRGRGDRRLGRERAWRYGS